MSINLLALVIVIALLIELAVNTAADILTVKKAETGPGCEVEQYYDAERFELSRQYFVANTHFKWIYSIFFLLVFFVFWFCGGFFWLDQWVRALVEPDVIRGLVYIGVLFLAKDIVSLPFSVYETFGIESRFGFNKTTPRVFIEDTAKQLLIAIVLGGILLSAILAFFEYAGAHAWIYCWITVSLFLAAMVFVVPTWIMPLFNRFEPLEHGPLKTAIFEYAAKINVPVKNVYIMDGSRRSAKSNAFFAGFGRSRKIVLYDTLVEKHTVAELVSVLAHEMGHYKKRHMLWILAASVVHAGLVFFLLSLFVGSRALADAFFIDEPSVYAGLVFFFILYSPIDLVIGIFFNALSRKNEYEADRFAVETTGTPEAMEKALMKLAAHNLANLAPHWFYVFLNHSHPPVFERIAAIRSSAAGCADDDMPEKFTPGSR